MQSQTKHEVLKVLEKYHQLLLMENMKAVPDKSHFFLNLVKFLGHVIEGNTMIALRRNNQNFNLHQKQRKPKIFMEC